MAEKNLKFYLQIMHLVDNELYLSLVRLFPHATKVKSCKNKRRLLQKKKREDLKCLFKRQGVKDITISFQRLPNKRKQHNYSTSKSQFC